MNLLKKKKLTSRMLGIGKKRIIFSKSRIGEIKEAITKQDIRDLKNEGAIIVKNTTGRRKNEKKRQRRSPGNIRKKVNKRKKEYVALTRKLRKHLSELTKHGRISREELKGFRKGVRNSSFRSKSHLKDHIKNIRK